MHDFCQVLHGHYLVCQGSHHGALLRHLQVGKPGVAVLLVTVWMASLLCFAAGGQPENAALSEAI